MADEPTKSQYDRYFELSNLERELTPAEEEEFEDLEGLVTPWLHRIDYHQLAIEGSGLHGVVEALEGRRHLHPLDLGPVHRRPGTRAAPD